LALARNIRWLVCIFLPVEIAQIESNPTLGITQVRGWRSVLILGIRRALGWRIVLSFGIGRAWGSSKVLCNEVFALDVSPGHTTTGRA